MPHSDLHKTKRKKNFTVLAIIMFAVILFWAITMIKIGKAEAADPVSCGTPIASKVGEESPYPVCDMYSRQIAYREESVHLRKQIQARAENYASTRRIATQNYKKQLQDLHDSISEDNITSIGTP